MAQTLKFGDGTWATKKGSTLAYNDEDNNYKPLPFATTRSTSATRVNKQGLIEVVEGDRPRIDYTDTSDGALLLEPQRTNLVTYSNDFTDASWSGVFIENNGISPNGTQNADKFVFAQGASYPQFYKSVSGLVVGQEYTSTIYIKKTQNSSDFQIISSGTPFNPTNEWQRVVKTFTATSTTQTVLLNYVVSVGVGVINEIYVAFAQLEQSSYATSYIPTSGSAATRVADTASGSGNSEVFNDSSGVLFADIAALTQDNDNTVELCINNGTTNNRLSISLQTATNALRVVARVSGVNQVNRTKTLSDITLFNKIAFKYKQNDYSVFVNGFEILTDTIGTTFPTSTLNTFDFDRADGGTPFYGKTKQIGYYNTILTDLELETLTSYRTWLSMVNELNLNVIYNG